MTEKVKIRIDNNSKTLIREQMGKEIQKIGFISELGFSMSTILIFDDCTLKLINEPIVSDCFGEEYPHFSIIKINTDDKLTFSDYKYEYIKINFEISHIELLTDKVSWEINGENGYFDIQNGMILHEPNGNQIIIYAPDSIAGVISIYTNRYEFEEQNKVRDHYPIECATNIQYNRVIESIS